MSRKKNPIFESFSDIYEPYKSIYNQYRAIKTKDIQPRPVSIFAVPVKLPTNFRLDPPFRPSDLWIQESREVDLIGSLQAVIQMLMDIYDIAPEATVDTESYYEYDQTYYRVNVTWWRKADEDELTLYNQLEEARGQEQDIWNQKRLDDARELLRKAGEL